MNIKFTDAEKQFALKYSSQLEKKAKVWCILRWPAILFFLIGIGVFLFTGDVGNILGEVMVARGAIISDNGTPTPETNASNIETLSVLIDAKADLLRAELGDAMRGFIGYWVCFVLFLCVLSGWHRDQRDRLMAKVLRSVADNNEPEA